MINVDAHNGGSCSNTMILFERSIALEVIDMQEVLVETALAMRGHMQAWVFVAYMDDVTG